MQTSLPSLDTSVHSLGRHFASLLFSSPSLWRCVFVQLAMVSDSAGVRIERDYCVQRPCIKPPEPYLYWLACAKS